MFSQSKQLKAAYARLFALDDGKKVLRDLTQKHFMFTNTLVENDSLTTAFNEGQRAVVLRILALLNQEPQWPYEEMER